MREFDFDFRTGTATLRFEKGKKVEFKNLYTVVKKSGFTTKRIELEATGRLIRATGPEGQALLKLEIKERKQSFILASGQDEETKRNYFELSKWPDAGKEFWIRGPVHTHRENDPGLVVGRYRMNK